MWRNVEQYACMRITGGGGSSHGIYRLRELDANSMKKNIAHDDVT